MHTLPLLIALLASPAQSACLPEDGDRASLEALRADGFSLDDPATRTRWALALVPCLDAVDPGLRDDLALGALTAWMRSGALDLPTLRALRDAGFARIQHDDPDGFGRPFAALMLAEVSRTDRISPWMSDKEREAMLQHATDYLAGIRDYRGYDAAHGWRHGVAHGADWLMQLALNPALDDAQSRRILDAVASQVVPPVQHAYVAGEYERLARPVLYVAARGNLDEDAWHAWLAALSAKVGDPAQAWRSEDGIVRRHNLFAFLASIGAQLGTTTNPAYSGLRAAAANTLKRLP